MLLQQPPTATAAAALEPPGAPPPPLILEQEAFPQAPPVMGPPGGPPMPDGPLKITERTILRQPNVILPPPALQEEVVGGPPAGPPPCCSRPSSPHGGRSSPCGGPHASGGGGPPTMIIEEEQILEPQPIIKLDRHTVVIPAHSFSPRFIFLGEQWLPAPTETHANGSHRVCLVERARFGRRDSRKGDAYRAQVYRQVAAHTPQFEKVLISTKDTETLGCTGRDTDHMRLQARALTEILPSVSITTSATEVQHMRYSLVDYTLENIQNINTEALKETVGDSCHQPIYLLLRIYECTRVPDLSPPSTPTSGAPGNPYGGPHEETEGWAVIYEAPPVELGDRSKVSPEAVRMHDGSRFYYKHSIIPAQAKLFEEPKELNAVLPPQGRPVRSRLGFRV